MSKITPPFYPIIYVRGYAGNDDEIDAAVADPYMGFNIGATKFRQKWTGAVQRHFFESPLYRLTKEFGYTDVYSNGEAMPEGFKLSSRCVVVYRYYDEQFFEDLSQPGDLSKITGKRREIEQFADGLSALILRLQDNICTSAAEKKAFKVYLVAHSMGGLICRCFLQNNKVGDKNAKKLVDKVFTYASPHGGIDFSVIGNVPSFFSMNNINNFNEGRMREYLGFAKNDKRSLPSDLKGKFDPDRFFCLVGTNWNDYTVANGWSKRLVGPMSDGLVRIANASVTDTKTQKHCPRAFVHRSHSGSIGIVNSEDGYQNLVRFLFGNIRVDGVLKVNELSLPKAVEDARHAGKKVRASYNFETVVRVRGADWDLHRRTTDEQSAIFRTFDEMFPSNGTARNPHLFSVFLMNSAVVGKGKALVFAIELAIQVPEYEVDGFLWLDQKIRGSYLFRDTLTLAATPSAAKEGYTLKYGFDSETPLEAKHKAKAHSSDDSVVFEVPIKSKTTPGIRLCQKTVI